MFSYVFNGYIPCEGYFSKNPTIGQKRAFRPLKPLDVGPFTEMLPSPVWHNDPTPEGRHAFNIDEVSWDQLQKIIDTRLDEDKEARRLALLMASHWRLGSNSPLAPVAREPTLLDLIMSLI